MIKSFLLLLFIPLITSCSNPENYIKKKFYKSGCIDIEISLSIKDTVPNGITKLYYDCGGIKSEYNLINGLKEGKSLVYYEDGKLMETLTFKSNNLHGPYESYYKSGFLESTGQYYNGKKIGLFTKNYDSSSILLGSEVLYIFGSMASLNSYKEYDKSKNLVSSSTLIEQFDDSGSKYLRIIKPVYDSIYVERVVFESPYMVNPEFVKNNTREIIPVKDNSFKIHEEDTIRYILHQIKRENKTLNGQPVIDEIDRFMFIDIIDGKLFY